MSLLLEDFMTLLIVDDNPEIRKILRHLLTDKFDELYEAVNGREAIELYEKHKTDWVLMDIEMAEVDGLTAIKAIKNKYNEAKIIAVSKFDDKEIIKLSKYIGAVDYFNKDDLNKIAEFFDSQIASSK